MVSISRREIYGDGSVQELGYAAMKKICRKHSICDNHVWSRKRGRDWSSYFNPDSSYTTATTSKEFQIEHRYRQPTFHNRTPVFLVPPSCKLHMLTIFAGVAERHAAHLIICFAECGPTPWGQVCRQYSFLRVMRKLWYKMEIWRRYTGID